MKALARIGDASFVGSVFKALSCTKRKKRNEGAVMSEYAEYEVWYRGGAIAWFIAEDDARDFIGSQPDQVLYEVKRVSRND